jgi:hypothetical protein
VGSRINPEYPHLSRPASPQPHAFHKRNRAISTAGWSEEHLTFPPSPLKLNKDFPEDFSYVIEYVIA